MIAPPTLNDVLALSDEEAIAELSNRPRRYLTQVKAADDATKEQVNALLGTIWPDKPLRMCVKRSGVEVTIAFALHAILVLGPASQMQLTPEQWADVATCGVVLSDQAGWLREQYTDEGLVRACEICDAPDARTWSQIVSAIPDSADLPSALAQAIDTHLRETPEGDDIFYLRSLSRRLAEAGELDLLLSLSDRNAVFRTELLPALSALGDVPAARQLLADLAKNVADGGRSDRYEVEWMSGINAPELLPDLFSTFKEVLEHEREPVLGALPSLTAAIRRVGGVEAVRLYDEMISSSENPRFKFSRSYRDDVLNDLLERTGQAAAVEAAKGLSLPILG